MILVSFSLPYHKATVAVTVKDPNAPEESTAPSNAPSTDAPSSSEPSAEPTTPGVTEGNVSVNLTNAIQGDDTILAGNNAVYEVTVKDDAGKPVANKSVVISLDEDKIPRGNKKYKVSDATTVVTTDADGIATFVVTPDSNGITVENTDDEYVGSYKYTVKVGNETKEGSLKVAAIVYGVNAGRSVDNLNGKDGYKDLYKDLVPGKNVDTSKYESLRNTKDVNQHNVEYVGAQQVTTPNGDDHTVAFKTDVCLYLPDYSGEKESAQREIQPLNWKSEPYHTYEEGSKERKTQDDATLLDDLSEVAYATVHFNSLKLSKHTSAVVELSKDGKDWGDAPIKTYGYEDVTFEGTEGTGAFSLQIERNELKDKKYIRISLKSAGQVDLDNNAGYDVKDIEYVFNAQKSNAGGVVHFDGVDINWKRETIGQDVYYDDEVRIRFDGKNEEEKSKNVYWNGEKAVTDDTTGVVANAVVEAVKGLTGSEDDCSSITYQVPAFPRVGNAIIRCKDKNNVTKKIFACATRNNGDNKNILYWNNVSNAEQKDLFYEITEQEAKQSADGDIVTQGNGTVTVNAEKSGITHLVGEISSSDPLIRKALDEKNKYVYTSVMWNPVIDTTNDVPGIAFAGQTATVTAQLIDDNDNPVAKADQPIAWTIPKEYADLGVKIVEEQTSTNPEGKAVLRLSAAEAAELIGVNASTNSGYKVKLMLAGNETKVAADIYWLDLHLAYKETSLKEYNEDKEYPNTIENGTASGKATANVGEKWEYASQVIARTKTEKRASQEKFEKGVLAGKKVKSIAGIIPTASKRASSKCEVTPNADGSATATSTTAVASGEGGVVFRLNADNSPKKPEDVSVVLDNDTVYGIIGSGNLAANDTLNLDCEFKTAGVVMAFRTPNGNKSAEYLPAPSATVTPGGKDYTKDDQIVYIQLQDSFGNPIKKLGDGERIKVSVEGKGAYIAEIQPTPDAYENTVPVFTPNPSYTPSTPAPSTTPSPEIFTTEELKGENKDNLANAAGGESSNKKTVIYSTLSKVNSKSDPNTDGILAIKLEDTEKESVVVTASYEKVSGGKASPITDPQSMTYSFTDAGKLPVFAFDTAQDNGRNRIYFDSDKKEITLAFTNDVLASSVKDKQFTVKKSILDNGAFKEDDSTELLVKANGVSVEGNKVIIKIDGKVDVQKDDYFEVTIADSDDSPVFDTNSIRYFFNSVDGQELRGDAQKKIVFPADSSESMARDFAKKAVEKLFSINDSDPQKDWSKADAADVAEMAQLLAEAGISLPTAEIEEELRSQLQAIYDMLAARGVNKDNVDADQLKRIVDEAMKVLSTDEDTTVLLSSGRQALVNPKKVNGKTLKGAAREVSLGTIKNKNEVITSTTATPSALTTVTGAALGVTVTVTGASVSSIKVGEETVNLTNGIGFFAVKADDISRELSLIGADDEKDFKVTMEVQGRYYKRTYTISVVKGKVDSITSVLTAEFTRNSEYYNKVESSYV